MKINKTFAVLSILILTGLSNYAQDFGFKAGINFSHISPNFDNNIFYVSGIHFGPMMELKISGNIFLNSELQFSEKGEKIDGDNSILLPVFKTKLDYLETTQCLKYKLSPKNLKPFIKTGPYLGYALSGKTYSNEDKREIDFKNPVNSYGRIDKRIDFGWNFGLGLEFRNLLFEANWETGITNLENTPNASANNQTILVSVCYIIRNTKKN